MSVQSESSAIRIETLAVAANISVNTLRVALRYGQVPPADAFIDRGGCGVPARGWKLSTIARWRPDVAARCQGILEVVQAHELTAA